ncbi:IS701 family transposase [Streptomyces sp. NPDC127092]|uniref:IS701 family transposase n=1 Tax=Streptomyces sp. NPDC127092 TaxID=3347135 RepID=UPI0036516011
MRVRRSRGSGELAGRDGVAREVAGRLLASLPRRDQRAKGERYVEGLLRVQGRKTMRAIAAVAGGGAAEQSVHHFISKSSWDWSPVRRDLGRFVEQALVPKAWVVHPLAIPKLGRHSVGVQESYVASLGRMANSQQAYGVWCVGDAASAPVDWHLLLPPGWVADGERRRRAEIPDGLAEVDADRAVLDAVRRTVDGWVSRPRPVVVDARQIEDLVGLVDGMREAGLPFVVRIRESAPLAPADAPSAGGERRGPGAWRIAQGARPAALPVRWAERAPEGEPQPLAARVPVVLRDPGRRALRTPLAMVAAWADSQATAGELWLTNLFAASPGEVLELGRLLRRVENDMEEIGGRVGLKDFEGRCYGGWHRHVTLCSIAYAIAALGQHRGVADELLSA